MSFMRFSLLFVPRDPRDAAPSPQHAAAVAKLPVLRLRCGRSIRPTSAMKRLGTRIDDRRSFVCWTVGTCPATENEMSIFKKTALSFAALSVVAAPVAASAASSASRAASATTGANELEGNSSWIIGIVGLLVGVGANILGADNEARA